MRFYNDWAQRILRGELTDHLAFYGLPGYAYLLALLYRVFGYNPFVPGLLQASLDAGTAVLIFLLTLEIFRAKPSSAANDGGNVLGYVAAAIAALSWVFFVPAEAYSVILMPTAWLAFAFWLVVWRLVRSRAALRMIECYLLGLLIGITATAVANILLLIPLVLAAVIIKSRFDRSRLWKNLAWGTTLVLVGVGVGTAPCWVHNYFVARDPVFLSAHSGINFWIGNSPGANGYPRFPPGLRAGQAAMLQDSIDQAESAAGRTLRHSQISAYWSNRAEEYISTHLGDWLKLLGLKLRNFCNAFQYDDLSVITSLREQRVIFPGCYFGLVAAFGIPGLCFAAWHAPRSRWIITAIVMSIFGILAVFVTERYRLVAAPGLLILAGYGLASFWKSCTSGRIGATGIYLVLLAGTTALVSSPRREPSLWALDAYNSGWQALESNNLPLAEKKLAIAYAYAPTNPETNFALGNLRLAQNQTRAAQSFYQAVLQIDPQHKGALNNLGLITFEQGSFEQARQFFEEALSLAPRDAKAHYLIAKTFHAEGNETAAEKAIDRALSLNPNQREFIDLKNEIDKQPTK